MLRSSQDCEMPRPNIAATVRGRIELPVGECLLRSQGCDRLESGRAHRRIEAKDDSERT